MSDGMIRYRVEIEGWDEGAWLELDVDPALLRDDELEMVVRLILKGLGVKVAGFNRESPAEAIVALTGRRVTRISKHDGRQWFHDYRWPLSEPTQVAYRADSEAPPNPPRLRTFPASRRTGEARMG